MEDDYKPAEKSDPLAEDSLVEKIVWQVSIWIAYAMFIALFIVSLVG